MGAVVAAAALAPEVTLPVTESGLGIEAAAARPFIVRQPAKHNFTVCA